MAKTTKFTMPFEPMTIEHLGLRLYSTLPPVIGELVSNAYDAESNRVEVTIPQGAVDEASEVIVRDYGHGLTGREIQHEFLPIGRARRGHNASKVMSKNGKVRVTGRKGLGKLSAFGVASEVETLFVKSGKAICLKLNYDDMKAWGTKHPTRHYEPTVVGERCGITTEPDGAEIRLRKLHRKRAIDADDLRKGLARRLTVIGRAFQVVVNGTAIKPGDRMRKSQCPDGFSWDVSEMPEDGHVADDLRVKGWFGFLEASSQANRGVDIFANKKAAELGSFFNLASTHAQFARAHLVGEIHADFLDGTDDLISTARNSVVWESESGQLLQDWGQTALKWAFNKWLEKRHAQKESDIFNTAGFAEWLDTRQPSEQRVAKRMVGLLIDDPNIDPESAGPLLEIVKSSVETVAFRELVEAIEAEGANAKTLLKLFREWRVIEARERLKQADGRLEAIQRLKVFMDKGALEVQEMQPLFEQHPWLIDTTWSETDGQTTYTQLLRKYCVEPKDYDDADRRIDILGIRSGGGVTVVELKRPEKTLSRRDLEQVEKYVDWATARFEGTGPDAPRYINGLLIVGKLSQASDIQKKQRRLAGDDIRVETYDDLYERAREYFNQVDAVLGKIAPEYTRKRRKASKKK